jgi:hypothetical protein
MNNLAELTSVRLDDPTTIKNNWDNLVSSTSHVWDSRNYVGLGFFNEYYKKLLSDIIESVGVPYKNIVIQCHDKSLKDGKWYLTTTHRDDDRFTCVTIPIVYNLQEPINFYDDSIVVPPRGKPNTQKPIQTSLYSSKNPTLVNVSNLHNVRVIQDNFPRILLQISYDYKFDDIVSKKPNIWNIF